MNNPQQLASSLSSGERIAQAKERLLLAMAALGATRPDSELAVKVDALIAAVSASYEDEIANLKAEIFALRSQRS